MEQDALQAELQEIRRLLEIIVYRRNPPRTVELTGAGKLTMEGDAKEGVPVLLVPMGGPLEKIERDEGIPIVETWMGDQGEMDNWTRMFCRSYITNEPMALRYMRDRWKT